MSGGHSYEVNNGGFSYGDDRALQLSSGLSTLTSGAVLFGGTDGNVQQDATNLFWDNTNNRLGIGTASPANKLHVRGESDADSYVRVTSADGNESMIMGVVDGGGAAFFGSLTNHAFNIRTNNAGRWQFTAAGHLLAVDDNTYDIGSTGAARPKDLFIAGKATIGGEIEIDGALNHDGSTAGLYATAPVTQRLGGVTITNNVTAGGTTNQLDDFTSLTVYATDAAAIRNDIYQLGRKLKFITDALRTIGLCQDADS